MNVYLHKLKIFIVLDLHFDLFLTFKKINCLRYFSRFTNFLSSKSGMLIIIRIINTKNSLANLEKGERHSK